MVILMETKASGDDADNIMSYFNYPHSAKVDVVGNAGGIHIVLNNNDEVQPVALTRQEIYLFVKVNNFHFFTTVVYSRPYSIFKHALRTNFESFCRVYDGPWLTLGDFNDIAFENEKFRGNMPNFNRMHEFNKMINDSKLLNLGFTGPKYTWSNCRKKNLILERLDRCMANSSWLDKFSNAIVTHLPRVHSDHCLLTVNLSPTVKPTPKPFKIESMWLNHSSY